jgi:4-aminobutyrate aminotransferase
MKSSSPSVNRGKTKGLLPGGEVRKRIQREQGDVNTTPNRRRYWQRNLTDAARRWFETDCRYFLHQSLSTPVLNVLDRADGIYLQDLDGKRYIDMHGNGVHNVGFNNPEVLAAVRRALENRQTFCPRRYTSIPAVRLARKLAHITPGNLCRSLFAPGGSEAIEMALMLARLATGRYKTLSFWDSFHGAGFGAASIGGEEHFSARLGPMVPGALRVEFPNYYRNPWAFGNEEEVDGECLRQIEMVLQREPEMAALIGEPISATPVVPSRRYWQGVRGLCERYGVLLIFDEIIEGLGRTGKLFACEHFLTPDILVLGKSLGAGIVPFAGIVTRDRYNIGQERSIGHYTHEKNGLCASVALAVIDFLEQHRLWEHAASLGDHAMTRLRELSDRHPLIGNVAGMGLHIGIDLVKNRQTKRRAVDEAEMVMFRCLEKGLSFKTIEGNVITLRPALTITRGEMDRAIDILDESLEEVEAGKGYG